MSEQIRKRESKIGTAILWVLSFADIDEAYYDDIEIKVGDHEAVRPFFEAALRDRAPVYSFVLMATLAVSALIGWNRPDLFLQVLGLLLDLVGAFILGVGLLRSEVGIERDSIRTTKKATGTWGGFDREGRSTEYRDPLSVSSEARDTADACAGIIFLIVGFGLQVLAVLL